MGWVVSRVGGKCRDINEWEIKVLIFGMVCFVFFVFFLFYITSVGYSQVNPLVMARPGT